jgi:Domain of unknown function (DUF4337)
MTIPRSRRHRGGHSNLEANEAQELQEHAEHGAHEASMRPVAFTMSLLAVMVAVTTVLAHRAHTEAILMQNRATDQWNEYQAKKIRSYNTGLNADLMGVLSVADKDKAEKIAKAYADHQAKWNDELKEDQERAKTLEEHVERAEAHAVRFDLAEALMEIGLVITSVTLLTRSRLYWYLGLLFSACGLFSALSVALMK